MSTADDWEPLPEAQRASHPGELRDLVKRPAVAVPVVRESGVGESGVGESAVGESPAEPPPSGAPKNRPDRPPAPVAAVVARPLDPAAEQALAALKQRLAAAKPATSLIAEVQHREQRAERKLRVAKAAIAEVTAEPRAEVIAEPAPPAPPAPVMLDVDRSADVDPRESEPWFHDLPRREQERLRTHWWYDRHRHDDAGQKLRRRLGRALAYGALLFFVMGLLQAPLMGGLRVVPLLTVAGALAAAIAEVLGGGRVRYGVAGALAFVAVMGPALFLQPLALSSLMIAAYGMGTLGMDGEMRRTGGFGDG